MSFSLTVLGSSSALPTAKKFTTAHVLEVHGQYFLIDAGEGVQMQIRKYKISFSKINHLFISHLHGDHFFGLPGFISSLGLLGRKNDLHIYSHPSLQKILNTILDNVELKFKIIYHSLNYKKSELIFESKHLTVTSIPLVHRIPTCGFVFREKEKLRSIRKDMIQFYEIPIKDILSIKEGHDFETKDGTLVKNTHLTTAPPPAFSYAYCSDTKYTEKIIPYIKNVDLLYHEATFGEELKLLAQKTGHSTTVQAATIAHKAEVKKLLIGHFSSRYNDYRFLEKEAKKIFLNTKAVADGERYELRK